MIEKKENKPSFVSNRRALELDGNKGGIDEYIIPNWSENDAVEIIKVSGVNPEF